jgi:hypothetical protein
MPASEERVLERLGEQLDYYRRHAAKSRLAYLSVMTVKVAAAAAVSLTAVTSAPPPPPPPPPGLGALILVLEGVQQLGQFHANWIRYRTTEAALSREQHLWEAGADDYATGEPLTLLASRVEKISADETSAWAKDAAGTPPGAT